MRIKIVGSWQFELAPTTDAEEKILSDTYKHGHVHLVCKALLPTKRRKRKRLLLTPSIIDWKKP